MLPSPSMRKTTRRTTRNRRAASFGIGLAGSFVAHVCLLAGLFSAGRRELGRRPSAPEPGELTIAVTAIESPVDPEAVALGDPPLAHAVLPVARPWDAREGDRDNPIAVTVAPSEADGRVRRAPAPDEGARGGQPPDHAYRRDRSTLRARLTDGAAEAQPARLRTSRRPASPQAIRREPVVGIGDAARTRAPSRAPDPPVPGAERVLALGGDPAGATALDTRPAREAPPSTASRLAAIPLPDRALGPLDAEAGARSFDSERVGLPADDQTLRAASNERHPGLTDFSRPAAPARDADGGGAGARPGAGRDCPPLGRLGPDGARRARSPDRGPGRQRADPRPALPAL